VVAADIGEEWVAPPVRHLPFVPCRVLPRNVVMQDRVRWSDDGKGGKVLEPYLKPRITQNSSYGDEASVNAGVSDDERAIALPTVQEHGRASAICDTAGELGGARAERYVVDAESAYRAPPPARRGRRHKAQRSARVRAPGAPPAAPRAARAQSPRPSPRLPPPSAPCALGAWTA